MHHFITFKHAEAQQSYARQGYVILPFLNDTAVEQLYAVFNRHFSLDTLPEVYDTIATPEESTIKQVYQDIYSVCHPFLEQTVSHYFVAGAIFIVKKSHQESYMGLHIDPSMTLEEYNNIGIWIPLCDVDEQVGRMCLLPQSQYFLPPYNTPSLPCPYSDIEDLVRPDLVCFNMRKGEALFFNNSMLHCTEKNTSVITRIAVVMKLIDESAPLATVYYDPAAEAGKQVSVYEQERNIFTTDKFRSPKPLPGSRFVKYVPELPKEFTAAEYQQLMCAKK
jgi:hypothetical protein